MLALIQIAPVKINPWGALARWIGKAINGEVLDKLGRVEKRLDEHIKTRHELDPRNNLLCRFLFQIHCRPQRDKPLSRTGWLQPLKVTQFVIDLSYFEIAADAEYYFYILTAASEQADGYFTVAASRTVSATEVVDAGKRVPAIRNSCTFV